MPWLANLLARLVFETDVFGKTGLTGAYDFKLEFAPIGPNSPAESDPSGSPSLFSAVQSFGLKLDARKAPMKFLIVDHVDKLSEKTHADLAAAGEYATAGSNDWRARSSSERPSNDDVRAALKTMTLQECGGFRWPTMTGSWLASSLSTISRCTASGRRVSWESRMTTWWMPRVDLEDRFRWYRTSPRDWSRRAYFWMCLVP